MQNSLKLRETKLNSEIVAILILHAINCIPFKEYAVTSRKRFAILVIGLTRKVD